MPDFIPHANCIGLKFPDRPDIAFTLRAARADVKEIPFMTPPTMQGTVSIPAGSVLDFGTATRGIGGIVRLVRSGAGPKPIIKFRGAVQSAPFSIARGALLDIEGFDFDISPEAYMFFSRGAVKARGCTAINGGGLIGLRSADGDNVLEDCHTPLVGYYGAFTSAEAPERVDPKNPQSPYKLAADGGTIVVPNKSLQLINCTAVGRDATPVDPTRPLSATNPADGKTPFTHQHVVRCHALTYLLIRGGKYTGPQVAAGHCATLRPHDVGKVELIGVTVEGKSYFGPLAGGDGGIKLPVGSPERIRADKAQLGELLAGKCRFTGYITLASGLAKGRMEDGAIHCTMFRTAIVAEAKYMSRSMPALDLVRMAVTIKDTSKPGELVNAGHPEVRAGAGVMFQGKALPANPAVSA